MKDCVRLTLKSVLPPHGALAENISMVNRLSPFPFILNLPGLTWGREFLLTVSTSHVDTSSLLQLRGSEWRVTVSLYSLLRLYLTSISEGFL